jgi:two-component sensor histidine kinase
VTERKLNQEAIQHSLAEKTALLNEVHHRVKNNLQVVTSLLRLEAGRSVQPDTQTVLREMQGRVRAMALLHESLYRTGIFASVDLGTYLKQLATQAFRALAVQSGGVRLSLNMASIKVSMDLATPCGLLVNELISNALKHGFPNGHMGEVRLELQTVPDSALACLRVSDTGIGLPEDFEASRSTSLGLHLASDLARQMGGHLDIGPGATFEVQFPLEVQKSQVSNLK